MKYVNDKGQAVYYNVVEKAQGIRYVVLAISGQKLTGRDGEKTKSRTFRTERNATQFLNRNGYKYIG